MPDDGRNAATVPLKKVQKDEGVGGQCVKCTWESFWQIFDCKVTEVAVNKICEVLQIYAGKEVCRPDFTLQEIMENYMKVIKLAYSMFANLEQMQNKLDA